MAEYSADIPQTTARARCDDWRKLQLRVELQRDVIALEAYGAGLGKSEICRRMGIARSTLDRYILPADIGQLPAVLEDKRRRLLTETFDIRTDPFRPPPAQLPSRGRQLTVSGAGTFSWHELMSSR